ncbi:MAG: hypothetical protein K6L76_13105 [Agarilytica sp.]
MKHVLLLIILSMLGACASTKVKEGSISQEINNFKQAFVSTVLVESTEQNEDAMKTNRTLQEYTETRLNQLISENYAVVPPTKREGSLSFNLKINVTYGNRALRWLSPGAGRGSAVSVLEVRDGDSNEVLFSSSAESSLSMGAAGGSMTSVVEKNVDKLLKSFKKSISES